jgi:transcriptional regulator with XRE-family HTH domain
VRQPLRSIRRPEYDALLRVLTEARAESGVSQRTLAKRLGRTQGYVSKIEAGQQRLDVLEFTDYCTAIGSNPVQIYERFLKAVDHAD